MLLGRQLTDYAGWRPIVPFSSQAVLQALTRLELLGVHFRDNIESPWAHVDTVAEAEALLQHLLTAAGLRCRLRHLSYNDRLPDMPACTHNG